MRTLPFCGLIFLAASLHAQTAGILQPTIIVRNDPEYSAEATRARVQSTVLLSIVVGEDGKAHDIKVEQGAGFGLDEKAIEAMETWVFRPGTKDGKITALPANVEMNFHLQVKNDKEDHSGQFARLNFTLPPGASHPELIVGKLPGNPAATGDQALRFHIQVGIDGVPQNVTVLGSTDKVWEQQALRVIRAWRFRPASLDGAAIPSDGIFELAHSAPAEEEPVIVEQDDSARPAPRLPPAPIQIAGLLARGRHTATLLANGTVLLAGGESHQSDQPPGSASLKPLASAQIFDWATRTIANTGGMLAARADHTATLLRDGTVLIAGGEAAQPLASAEIFDPSTGRFLATGSLHEARASHTATLLNDGRVLICGGRGASGRDLASAEIYDPGTKTFRPAGNMTLARSSFQSVALKDGRVLLLGGPGAAGSTTEIFDPASGAFAAAGGMPAPRYGFSATLLNDGKVLIAGGGTDSNSGTAIAETLLYDPASKSFTDAGRMSQAREFHDAVRLKDGKVLISGGTPGLSGAPIAETEIFDPATATFAPGPVLHGRHTGHTSTLLDDGSVLVAGSGLIGNGTSAELLPR